MKSKVLVALSASIWFLPGASEAGTTFYNTQALFDAAAPSAFLLQDFSTVPAASVGVPLSSITLPSGTYTGSPNVFVSSPTSRLKPPWQLSPAPSPVLGCLA
jgi:hypothetical protein